MARWILLLLLVSFVVYRYLPRLRVTWFATAALFLAVVAVRAAQQHWA